MPRNPYVFVVGSPRSGTTLVQRMLDHHPQLAVSNDTHFITAGIGEDRVDAATPIRAEMVERALAYRTTSGKGFHDLGVPEETALALAAESSTYADWVVKLFDELARRRGKPLAGDKTPDYVKRIRKLRRLFPETRFVHIVRDGRDVALSVLDWGIRGGRRRGPAKRGAWDEDPVAASAEWWQGLVQRGREQGRRLGPSQYLEVRYEDLVAEPSATLETVSAFLGLPFAEEMLAYYEDQPLVRRPGTTSNLPPTPGLRDWRTQLSQRQLETFERIAAETLAAFGYPLSGTS